MVEISFSRFAFFSLDLIFLEKVRVNMWKIF